MTFTVCGSPAPQSQHGQPQAGSPSTPDPGAGITRWGRGGRDWRRGDPNLVNRLWKSKTPLGKMRQHLHNGVTRQACTNSGRPVAWWLNFVEWRLILVVLRMESASCHASGAKNFEVVPRLVENLIFVWPSIIKISNVEDQPDATITIYWYFNQLNMFRAIFCPSSGAQGCVLQRVV